MVVKRRGVVRVRMGVVREMEGEVCGMRVKVVEGGHWANVV